jgi:hypothetical protein
MPGRFPRNSTPSEIIVPLHTGFQRNRETIREAMILKYRRKSPQLLNEPLMGFKKKSA